MYSSHPPHTPRSILKQQHSPVPVGCRSPDRPPAVHFPPSPALTRVYAAHPSSAYDRSPIVVSPNTCALPERGCPGRTYTLEDECAARSAPSKRRPSNGNHFHPRAVSNPISTSPTRSIGDDHTRNPPRTSPFTPPPLIPDLSSESDESDSFVTPFDTPNTSLTPAPSISKPRIRTDAMMPTSPYCPAQPSFPDDYPSPYLPHRSSPDDVRKPRRRRSRDRSRERSRECSYASDETSGDGSYKSFSPPSSYTLREMDDGCLGGF
ncbi:hypothetical protein PISMIDRAFT_677509 [Pisolithus microcarpus 441]|uniref:Uncharacterized protein n=1 Tax=Pisolithus microcarpus 441 TaxID=765257 RepID=A0A0C9ZSK9_9AGAM|nr:hypothetical protein PISMIDRAFT_677509 [Pisolithus microcarpus 441]